MHADQTHSFKVLLEFFLGERGRLRGVRNFKILEHNPNGLSNVQKVVLAVFSEIIALLAMAGLVRAARVRVEDEHVQFGGCKRQVTQTDQSFSSFRVVLTPTVVDVHIWPERLALSNYS